MHDSNGHRRCYVERDVDADLFVVFAHERAITARIDDGHAAKSGRPQFSMSARHAVVLKKDIRIAIAPKPQR